MKAIQYLLMLLCVIIGGIFIGAKNYGPAAVLYGLAFCTAVDEVCRAIKGDA